MLECLNEEDSGRVPTAFCQLPAYFEEAKGGESTVGYLWLQIVKLIHCHIVKIRAVVSDRDC